MRNAAGAQEEEDARQAADMELQAIGSSEHDGVTAARILYNREARRLRRERIMKIVSGASPRWACGGAACVAPVLREPRLTLHLRLGFGRGGHSPQARTGRYASTPPQI